MPTVITGTDGVSQVQTGAVESGDLPAGSVIQVVSNTRPAGSGNLTTNSTSYVDLGFNLSITPKSASSNLLIILTGTFNQSGTIAIGDVAITDSANNVLANARTFVRTLGTSGGSAVAATPFGLQAYINSPGTSTVTYKIRAKVVLGPDTGLRGAGSHTLTIMEIAG